MARLSAVRIGPVALVAGVLAAHLAALSASGVRSSRAGIPASRTPAPWMLVSHGESSHPGPGPGRVATPRWATPAAEPPSTTPAGTAAGRDTSGSLQEAYPPGEAASAPHEPLPWAAWTAFRPPPAFHFDYVVHGERRSRPVEGRASLSWQPQPDGRYTMSMHTRLAGVPPHAQESSGRLRPEGLAPTRFSDRRRGEHVAHFDAEGGRFVFSRSGPQAGWQSGAQDPVSALAQLAGMAAADPSVVAPGREVLLQVAGTREVQEWRFVSHGLEIVTTPAGPVGAVRLLRSPPQPFDWRVEAWLAPSRDYGPVRLRLTQADGDWLDYLWPGTDNR